MLVRDSVAAVSDFHQKHHSLHEPGERPALVIGLPPVDSFGDLTRCELELNFPRELANYYQQPCEMIQVVASGYCKLALLALTHSFGDPFDSGAVNVSGQALSLLGPCGQVAIVPAFALVVVEMIHLAAHLGGELAHQDVYYSSALAAAVVVEAGLQSDEKKGLASNDLSTV